MGRVGMLNPMGENEGGGGGTERGETRHSKQRENKLKVNTKSKTCKKQTKNTRRYRPGISESVKSSNVLQMTE